MLDLPFLGMQMKKCLFELFGLMVALISNPLYGEVFTADVDFQMGYRQDRLHWDIGNPNGTPNILSELQWKDLKSFDTAGSLKLTNEKDYLVKFSGNYGIILSGNNQDSDYHGNNRTEEFSRSRADASGGHVFDLVLAIGRQFHYFAGSLKVSPVFGYSYYEQHLKMKRGVLLIFTADPSDIGPIYGLDSSYTAKWQSPFIGLDLNFQATSNLIFLAGIEVHYARFEGRGNWNLRYDFFKDFEHKADGHGLVFTLGSLYKIQKKLSIGIAIKGEAFKATNGRDRSYLLIESENQTIPFIIDGHFNKVKWCALSALVSINYSF